MPGTADHPITITAAPDRIRVSFAGRVVADSREALIVKEASYPPVSYIPRKDVNLALLQRTEHKTHCPYKGEASYYAIHAGGRVADNAIWSYEKPCTDMSAIAEYVAFYPDRVDGIERLPA